MNLQDFETQLEDFEIGKGFSLYKNNILSECKEVEAGKWNALARGSDYQVKVEIKENVVLNSSCSCPEGSSYCKHIIAILYAIKYGPYDAKITYKELPAVVPAKQPSNKTPAKDVPKKPAKDAPPKVLPEKTSRVTFPDLVRKLSLEELQDFIISYAQSDRQLRNTFQTQFIHKTAGGKAYYANIIQDAAKIAITKSNRGYIDAWHSKIAFKPIAMLLKKADEAFLLQQYNIVSDIAFAVIEGVQRMLEDGMDDSYGGSNESMVHAFKLLQQINGPDVPLDIKETLFTDSISIAFAKDYSNFGFESNWRNYLKSLINSEERKAKVIFAIDSLIEKYEKAGAAKEEGLAKWIKYRSYYI